MILSGERNVMRNSNKVIGCFHQLGCFTVVDVFRQGIVYVEDIFQYKLNKTMNFVQGCIIGSKHERRVAGIHTEVEDMQRHKNAKKPMKDVVAEEVHKLTYLHFFVGNFATVHIFATEVKKSKNNPTVLVVFAV